MNRMDAAGAGGGGGGEKAKTVSSLISPSMLQLMERLSVSAKGRIRGTLQGKRRSRTIGSSLEFADFRPYAQGDDIRRIDWNVFGRTGRAYIRQYWDEQELLVHLLIDVSPSMSFGDQREPAGKLRYAMQLAACIGYAALSGEDRAGLKLFDHKLHSELPLMRGKGALFRWIEFLEKALQDKQAQGKQEQSHGKQAQAGNQTPADAQAAAAAAKPQGKQAGQRQTAGQEAALSAASRETLSDLAAVFQSDVRLLPRQAGQTWLFTDGLYEQGIEETVKRLTGANQEVVFVQILSPEELRPSYEGELRLIDAEQGSGKDVAFGTSVHDAYRQALKQHCLAIEECCGRWGAVYVQVDTSRPVEQTINGLFRKTGLLRG